MLEDGNVVFGGASGQPSGPVWFLAGTFGGSAERHLTVPAGKSLLVPLINVVLWGPEDCAAQGIDPCDAEGVTAKVEQFNDASTNLVLTVDGAAVDRLDDYRATSAPYTLSIQPSTLWSDFGYDSGDRYPTVAGGHWVMLNPLSPGDHTVQWSATNDSLFGEFAVDVTYHLTVVAGN